MDILGELFGSNARVRLMRLFLFNPEGVFSLASITKRSKNSSKEIRKEINRLLSLGLIKKRKYIREINKEVRTKRGRRNIVKKVEEIGYFLDQKFPYLSALKNLIITVSLHADSFLVQKFATAGRIKLFIASGVFIQEWESRIDLLIVGDDINMTKLANVISVIEAEVGKEISYSAFSTEDFEYRLNIRDKLIRDIIDSPHIVILDKLGLSKN